MLAKNLPHTIEVAKALDAEIVISENCGVYPTWCASDRVRVLSSDDLPASPIPMIDNLHRAYMAAEAPFCFPLGDDDELIADGLAHHLNYLASESDCAAVYSSYVDVSDAGDMTVDLPSAEICDFRELAALMTGNPRFAPEAPLARTRFLKEAIASARPGVYFGFAQLTGLLSEGWVKFAGGEPATYRHINHGSNNAWKFAIENVEPMRAAWEWLVYKACEERGRGMNREEKAWWADHIAMRMTEYYALAAEGLRREGKDPGQYDWRAKLWSA